MLWPHHENSSAVSLLTLGGGLKMEEASLDRSIPGVCSLVSRELQKMLGAVAHTCHPSIWGFAL